MRLSFFLLSLTLLAGCLNSEPEFKKGDCLNPVDGSDIWRLESATEPLKGFRLKEKAWEPQLETLPDRIYSKVPCPI